jgi:hypothetical protein
MSEQMWEMWKEMCAAGILKGLNMNRVLSLDFCEVTFNLKYENQVGFF